MINTKDFIAKEIESSVQVKIKLMETRGLIDTVAQVADQVIAAYKNGNKTLFAGNGGSAADAQHLAAEFVSRFYFDRPGLPSIALSSDPSIVTAIGNDYGYENLFARQVEAQGRRGDVFFGISTSGQSPNVIKAIHKAREMGLTTVAMTSERGLEMAGLCDFAIVAPSDVTPKIQECHITIGHAICAGVEEALFRK
ncbi:MAG: SIS domain-containing protein [Bdellovibrionales bacterium]